MKTDFIHQFYYLWSVALLIPLWAFIIYTKKRSRVEMIYMGIIFGTGAMGLDKYCSFYDYWKPPTIFDGFNFESFHMVLSWGAFPPRFMNCYSTKNIIQEKIRTRSLS